MFTVSSHAARMFSLPTAVWLVPSPPILLVLIRIVDLHLCFIFITAVLTVLCAPFCVLLELHGT